MNILVTGADGQLVHISTAWLYSEFGKNFCKTMLNLTATKPELKVVFDQVGTPTYALDLANVLPCHSSEFPSPVTRPAYSVLDKTKIKETFGVEVPYWTDSLRLCIEKAKEN